MSGGGYRGGSTLIHPGSGWFSKSNPKKKNTRQQSLKELCDPVELSEARTQAANRRVQIQLNPKNTTKKLKSPTEIQEAARKELLQTRKKKRTERRRKVRSDVSKQRHD